MIYKLRYDNKQQAIDDLLNKGVYTTYEDTLVNGDMIEAVVELGEITIQNPEYDEMGNVIKELIVDKRYHVDVMSHKEIEFQNEIQVKNPKHTFFGH